MLGFDNVELEFEPEAIEEIAEKALERNTGARGLRGIIEECMTDIMFEAPSDKDIEKIIITKECVTEGKPPVIKRYDAPSLKEQLALPERENGGEAI